MLMNSSLGECKLVQPLWNTVWKILNEFKIELPYELAFLLMSIYLKKMKTLIRKDIVYVHCNIIYNSRGKEAT